jgi:hypothetical protein
MSHQSNSNSNFNLNNEQLLLINILNTMYNDNLRQINNLTNSNNEIRNLITSLLNNTGRSRNSYTNRSRNNWNYSNNRENNYRNNRNYEYNSPIVLDYIVPASWTTQNLNRNSNNNFSQLLQRFFDPIEVYPTPSQIEAATRIVRFNDIISPSSRSCPISLENFLENDMVSVIRQCGHIFNTEQLNTWFHSNCRCPVCRYDIRNYNPNGDLNNLNHESVSSIPVVPNTTNSSSDPNTTNTSGTPSTSGTSGTSNNSINSIYYALLSSAGSDSLLNFILDPSGNYSDSNSNSIINILNEYQRRNI